MDNDDQIKRREQDCRDTAAEQHPDAEITQGRSFFRVHAYHPHRVMRQQKGVGYAGVSQYL